MFLLAVNQTLHNEELIKEMQDKVISLQDHEISFLNDTIANIWATVGIGVGIIIAIAGIVGWIIRRSNARAETKMQEAEIKMNEATEKITYAESLINKATETIDKLEEYRSEVTTYRTGTEQKVKELSSMIDERMQDLKEIEGKTNRLAISHKVRVLLGEIENSLDYIDLRIVRLPNYENFNFKKDTQEYKELETRQRDLTTDYEIYKIKIENISLDEMNDFYQKCLDLQLKCLRLIEKIELFIGSLPVTENEPQQIRKYYKSEETSDAVLTSPE